MGAPATSGRTRAVSLERVARWGLLSILAFPALTSLAQLLGGERWLSPLPEGWPRGDRLSYAL